MKSCSSCGKINKEEAFFCIQCGFKFVQEVGKVLFLLQELKIWKDRGVISDEVYQNLKREYEEKITPKPTIIDLIAEAKKAFLENKFKEGEAKCEEVLKMDPSDFDALSLLIQFYRRQEKIDEAISRCKSFLALNPTRIFARKELESLLEEKRKREEAPLPLEERVVISVREKIEVTPEIKVVTEIPPKKEIQKPTFVQNLSAFLEEKNIKWIHILGGVLLLTGLIGLIRWQWGILGRYFIFTILTTLTVGFYWFGNYFLPRLKLSGLILLGVFSLLIPLNFIVINQYSIFGYLFDWNIWGTFTSLICTTVYIFMIFWLKEAFFLYLPSLSFIFLVYFIFKSFNLPICAFGLGFTPLAFAYFGGAFQLNKMNLKEYGVPLYYMGNALIVLVLWIILFRGRVSFSEELTTTTLIFFLFSGIYLSSSYMFEKKGFLYISSLLLVISSFLFLYKKYPEFEFYLYNYSLLLSILGMAFFGVGILNKKIYSEEFTLTYLKISSFLIAFTVLLIFGKAFFSFSFPTSPSEIFATSSGVLLCSIVYFLNSFFFKNKNYLYFSTFLFTYFFFLILKSLNIPSQFFSLSFILFSFLLIYSGYLFQNSIYKDYSLPLYHVGYFNSILSFFLALNFYSYLEIMIFVMALSSLLCFLSSFLFKDSRFLYAFLLTSSIFYGALVQFLLKIKILPEFWGEINYGLYFFPFAFLLWLLGFHFEEKRGEFSFPLYFGTFLTTLFSILGQFAYVSPSYYYKFTVFFTLLLYSLFSAVLSYIYYGRKLKLIEKEISIVPLFTYSSTSTFLIALLYFLRSLNFSWGLTSVILLLLSVIWFFKGYILKEINKEEWFKPLFVSSTILSFFSLLISASEISTYPFITFVLFTILYTSIVYLLKEEKFSYISLIIQIPVFFYLILNFPWGNYHLYMGLISLVLAGWTISFALSAKIFMSTFFSYTSSIFFSLFYFSLICLYFRIGETLPGYYGLSFIIFSPLLILISHLLKKSKWKELSEAPFLLAYIITFLAFFLSLSSYINWFIFDHKSLFLEERVVERNLSIFVMILFSAIYTFSWCSYKKSIYLYPATISFSLAFGLSIGITLAPYLQETCLFERNYGLYFSFLSFLFLIVGNLLAGKMKRELIEPLYNSSLGICFISLFSQLYYHNIFTLKSTIWITFFIYSAFFILASLIFRKELIFPNISKTEIFVYLSFFSFMIGYFYLPRTLKKEIFFYSFSDSFAILVSFGLSFFGNLLERKKFEEWGRPLYWGSLIFTSVAIIFSLFKLTSQSIGIFCINMILAIFLYFALAYLSKKPSFPLYFSSFIIFLSYYASFLFFCKVNPDLLKTFQENLGIIYIPGFTLIFLNLLSSHFFKDSSLVYLSTFLLAIGISHFFSFLFITNISNFAYPCLFSLIYAFQYWYLAKKFNCPYFAYFCSSILAIFYLITLLMSNFPKHYFLFLFIPFNIFLVSFAYYLKKIFPPNLFTHPFYYVGLAISLVSIFISLGIVKMASKIPFCYALLYGIFAYLEKSIFLTYLAPLTFTLSWTLSGHFYLPESLCFCGFWIGTLGILWLLLDWLIQKLKKPEFAKPFYFYTIAIAFLSPLISLSGAIEGARYTEFTPISCIVSGIIFASLFFIHHKTFFAHISFYFFLLTYYLPLLDKKIAFVDAYLIPLGVYLLVLGYFNKKLEKKLNLNLYYAIGFFIIFFSTTICTLQAKGTHSIILLFECIGAIFWGIHQKNRVSLGMGTAFLIVFIFTHTFNILVQIHWAFYASLAGILIIALGIIFERKREKILEFAKIQTEKLKSWD